MSEIPRIAAEGLVQTYFPDHEQVGSLPLEYVVILFLNDKIDITWLHVGLLICLPPECNLLVVLHSLLNVHLQHLPLILCLETLPLPIAHVTRTLHLLDHTRPDLPNLQDSTLTSTVGALNNIPNNDLAVDGQLHCLAIVQIFEANLDGVVDAGSFARTGSATPALPSEEHGEEIISTATGTTSPPILTDSLKAVLVVRRTLLRVAQYFVRSVDFFELVSISSLVGVVDLAQLEVGLLDFLRIRILFNA
mmetsp:Transcript_62366/g.184541  ORF Transcript_62366/g.184541 Transcript_62366/m.184541 type:complete len:249 (-) Transcript_62366:312-1058(-)